VVGSFDELRKRHTRTTVRGWVQMISEAVGEDNRRAKAADPGASAWVLIVDDLSDLSASVGRVLDQLNRTFVLFAAAVEIRKPYERHFWKLERVPVGNLSRAEASDLIRQAAYGAEIEDYRLFETHVLQQSAGNPRAILEMVDRLRKEPSISRSAVRGVGHEGARGKLDLTPALVVIGAALFAFRYVSRGMDSIDGYMLAGIGSAVVMVLRFFLSRIRK
jgi:integrase/recombinase XerD